MFGGILIVEECLVVVSNATTRRIKVERIESGNVVSPEISVFKGMKVPAVNSYVACIFLKNRAYLLGELD